VAAEENAITQNEKKNCVHLLILKNSTGSKTLPTIRRRGTWETIYLHNAYCERHLVRRARKALASVSEKGERSYAPSSGGKGEHKRLGDELPKETIRDQKEGRRSIRSQADRKREKQSTEAGLKEIA